IKEPEKAKRPRGKDGELEQLKQKAEATKAAAQAKAKLAKDKEHESHQVHEAVNYIDYGHLAGEMALVLCSVAVLTKQRGFWFSGILVAAIGIGVATMGVVPYVKAEMAEGQAAGHHDDAHPKE